MYAPGCPARSLAGHDKDRYYMIWSVDADYVMLVDGRIRTTDRPKRKKKKHIQAGKTALLPGLPATDEAIRRALEDYMNSHRSI